MLQPMIEVMELEKRFGAATALRGLSFELAAGEVVGFVGPNGAGKTTTLRILCGYLAPDAGQVIVGGLDLGARGDEVCEHLGYMPGRAPLEEEMRVDEYLRYRARLKGASRSLAKERTVELIDELELEEVGKRLIGRLSKGFRQRVALADALISRPRVLLLDEPFSGLDPIQRRAFRELLSRSTRDCCVLFSSHVLAELEQLVGRFIFIHRGRLIGDGDHQSLARQAGLAEDAALDDVFAALVDASEQESSAA